MSDAGRRRVVPRMGDVGIRECLFLKNKLKEASHVLQKLIDENKQLKEDNQHLRKLLWQEMTAREVDMDEAMEDS
jgi:regulator of replication initiation timing